MVRPERAETETWISPFIWLWTLIFFVHVSSGVPPGSSPVTAGAGGGEGKVVGGGGIFGQAHVELGENMGLWPQYTDR